MTRMIVSLILASPSTENPQHVPHLLLPLLKFGHGVPLIAGVLVVVMLLCYAFFKLAHMRSA